MDDIIANVFDLYNRLTFQKKLLYTEIRVSKLALLTKRQALDIFPLSCHLDKPNLNRELFMRNSIKRT